MEILTFLHISFILFLILKLCAVPADPENVALQDANATSATVTWDIGVGVDESLISFSIANGANIEQDRNVTATSYQYDNLNPGTSYEFSVRTRNIAGESGTETFTFQTGMVTFHSTNLCGCYFDFDGIAKAYSKYAFR